MSNFSNALYVFHCIFVRAEHSCLMVANRNLERKMKFMEENVVDNLSGSFNVDLVPTRLESDVSDEETEEEDDCSLFETDIEDVLRHVHTKTLSWKFEGLTLWVELEEFNNDITSTINSMAVSHNVELIPKSHMTAIYGMTHLSVESAVDKLKQIPGLFPNGWPVFDRPVGIVTDLAVAGRPGQVCSIAWAELTLSSNEHHEEAIDKLYALFYPEESSRPVRHRPWKPHNSIAYDNPEDNVLSLGETFKFVAKQPTLLTKERRVKAISLWDTNGTMSDWKCLDRVNFW